MTALQIACLVLVVVSTVVGVAVFTRGVVAIVRTLQIGAPAPERWRPFGPRLWLVVRELVGHGRFQHRPAIRVAHWSVMVSFPILFLTLVSGYGQVADPAYSLPVLGHMPPLEWVTEGIAWLSLAGILALIRVRLTRPITWGLRPGDTRRKIASAWSASAAGRRQTKRPSLAT